MSSLSSSYQNHFRIKPLLITHAWIVISLITLFSPSTHFIWDWIDRAVFTTLNSSLNFGRPWQILWALANHKMADWVEDVVILAFCFIYVKQGPKEDRLYRSSQMLFMILYSALIIFFINKIIVRDLVNITRYSPTLVIENSIRLSDHITWLKIKDGSSKSFPGDHATTAQLFGLTFILLGSRPLKIMAGLYAIFLCLPRMILGAHWFTDIFVGSGAIVLFFMSWAYCTPFSFHIANGLEKFMKLFQTKKVSA
jgi:membrane-associated phospholipid phosphatase